MMDEKISTTDQNQFEVNAILDEEYWQQIDRVASSTEAILPSRKSFIGTSSTIEELIRQLDDFYRSFNTTESSTKLASLNLVEYELSLLIGMGKMVNFETYEKLDFANRLYLFIIKYDGQAIALLCNHILSPSADVNLASNLLLLLSRMEHVQSYSDRLWLLEKCLQSQSKYIRDASSIGIAYLDDPHSLPMLKRAAGVETSRLLKKSIEKIILQLENTQSCQ
jgi:hypothetical protein